MVGIGKCCIFASTNKQKNNLNLKTRKGNGKMKQEKKQTMKVFDSIDLDIQEVEDFIMENCLSFTCNEKMQVISSEEDFDKLITRFPEIDYVEA